MRCCGKVKPSDFGIDLPGSCRNEDSNQYYEIGCFETVEGIIRGSSLSMASFTLLSGLSQVAGIAYARNAIRNTQKVLQKLPSL
jgi:hypothetical protein